jgi:hypothetical protein
MDPAHPPIEPPTLPPAAIAALNAGNKIEAIKIVRQEQRHGLKEAKDLVAVEGSGAGPRLPGGAVPRVASSGRCGWTA